MKSFEAFHFKKNFGAVAALRDAGFRFAGPKICGLVGANGSGKTTFARICAGLIRRDAGEFKIDGSPVEISSPRDARRLGIVLAHQNLSLIPDLTVWENIILGHEERKSRFFLDNRRAREISAEILNDLIPGELDLEAKVIDLSPAQKQMVEIAKALSRKPKMLILDEPTAALEYYHVEQLFKKIKSLKADGVSVIFISHRLWEITRLCDLVIAFRNGETAGTIDFETQPREEKLIVPLVAGEDGCVVDFEKKEPADLDRTETVLALDKVSHRKRLRDISFSIRAGEVLGVGGLHGQGQEELIMLLAGSLQPTGGKITLGEERYGPKHPRDAIRSAVYLVPGDRLEEGLFTGHSIFDNVIYPRFCLKGTGIVHKFKELMALTDRIISKTEIKTPHARNIVSNLSGGNQQKVVFGRWLQFTPRVLLLNDPAKGIDIQAKDTLYRLVQELARQGTAVILYASSNEELICNCDRVLIMFEGRIADEIGHADLSDEVLIKSSLRVKAAS